MKSPEPFFSIPAYHDYLSPAFARKLLQEAKPIAEAPNLRIVGKPAGLESPEALRLLAALYAELRPKLAELLARRAQDRTFIDERTRACHEFNQALGRDPLDPDYKTVIGLEDAEGRIVFGPKRPDYCRPGGAQIAPLPEYLKGPHVTLFGPPDSAKLAINAMNSFHRKLPNEPAIVSELLNAQEAAPMWGADDEDSKTPLHSDLVESAQNLTACFEGTLSLQEGQKTYELETSRLALPIKRFPGLALPSAFLFYDEDPIPLHLYDFALHVFHNRDNPRALVFYVPKLENEEEARYIHQLVEITEGLLKKLNPSYVLGSIRLMIVLENPRAIVRAHEIIDALYPYFAGASLGWHDFLASTARLFKEDSSYRIPVKADPNIVIKYIKASHRLLADVVGSRGGVKVGGMYGILPQSGDRESLQLTLRGFFRDVITQLKRDLNGFWVAHPDFVRIGLALVEAWKRHQQGDATSLNKLIQGMLDEKYAKEVTDFVQGPDILSLNIEDPHYVRSLIVANLKESDFIANHHPDEVRYNVFQALQYLTDWLSGNGCVALPTQIDGVPVRVMDDLATAERSRWEVWHEVRHGRVSVETLIEIAHEEMNFIRRDLSDGKKVVQVKWDERTARWYPIAYKLMLQLMTASNPPEFATELLLPFTAESIRRAQNPWTALQITDSNKYRLSRYVADFDHYFEICGSRRFASEMANRSVEDLDLAKNIVLGFSDSEILSSAGFHGDIGQNKATLDARAASEQARASESGDSIRQELLHLGEEYKKRFGFKFLISAQGKTALELLAALKERVKNSVADERENARLALWAITEKRLKAGGRDLMTRLEKIRSDHGIVGVSVAINHQGSTQELSLGEAVKGKRPVESKTRFQLASLSKTLASAFAVEYFHTRSIPLSTPVNDLFARSASSYRIPSPAAEPAWAAKVTLRDLMSHSALNMHYVNGFPADGAMPNAGELLLGRAAPTYEPICVATEPGTCFQYSGGGFLVLEHLIESLEKRPIHELTLTFLTKLGLNDLTLDPSDPQSEKALARGYFDSGETVPGGHLSFPSFAAGGSGTAGGMARFLAKLTRAFRTEETAPEALAHETAVEMLHASDKGCRAFMGCDMGLGVFVAETGPNRLAIHQGANEGFRALYLQCVDGPDRGKGFVILCNGDDRAVAMIAELACTLLGELDIQGVNLDKLGCRFDMKDVAKEQIVNLGYKTLIFDAFEPDLPEPIVSKGPLDPLASRNLAVGAKILRVSNQKFARAENLVSNHLPVFDPELFGRQGKIMDSWESARHNRLPCDVLELELTRPSSIRYVSLSTKFHDGNQAQFVRVLGRSSTTADWQEVLPKVSLEGHSLLRVDLGSTPESSPERCTQIRVEMFPDGGLSRLGLFSELPLEVAREFQSIASARSVRFSDPIPKSRKPLTIPYEPTRDEVASNFDRAIGLIDPASLAWGGAVVRASNEHYGPAAQVISPFPPLHMFDGLESARSRKLGHHEEVQLRLARPTRLTSVLLDFTYFVNNNPLEVSIHGMNDGQWVELVSRTAVKAYAGNFRTFKIPPSSKTFDNLLVRTYPDGGINRIRVSGSPA